MRSRIIATAAVAVAALILAGCSTPGESAPEGDDVFRIAQFTPGYGTPAVKYTVDTVMANAEHLGWEVELYAQDSDFNALNSDIQTALLEDFDAFVFDRGDPRAMEVGMQATQEAGIPIFALDSDVQPNDAFAINVTSSQTEAAQLGVDALIEAMGGAEGKNVMTIGFDLSLAIQTRQAAATQLLEEAGAIVETRQIQNALNSQEETLNFITNHLQANPGGLDGVWTGLDPAALGAVQAVAESGADIYVGSVDAMGPAVGMIAEGGPFVATVQQDWDAMVDVLIEALATYQEDGSLPEASYVEIPSTLVTRDNAADITPYY